MAGYDKLLENLDTDLEWAEAAGEWEVPLCLADDLREAIKILKRKTAADIYEETETGLKVLNMIGGWCEAYAQGREVIVAPCAVGDTVYFKTYEHGDYVGIKPHKVDHIMAYAAVNGKGGLTTFLAFEEFGESVFLTREEAEAALKKRTQPLVEWVKEDAEQ